MSASLSSEDRADPNLTPILDMVFQLITFFMLVINFKAASTDMSLKLPAIGSARPTEVRGQDLLVLNVNQEGTLRAFGQEIRDIPAFIAKEAESSLRTAQRANSALKAGDDLPSLVVIRADRFTPFGRLNRVVRACQENGFRQFSLRALNRSDEP
jgi:biopolymer transport protein ExbD